MIVFDEESEKTQQRFAAEGNNKALATIRQCVDLKLEFAALKIENFELSRALIQTKSFAFDHVEQYRMKRRK